MADETARTNSVLRSMTFFLLLDGFAVSELGAVDLARYCGRELARRAVENDRALAHADDAVAIVPGGLQQVQVADHRDAILPVDAAQGVHHDGGIALVERGDRLVGEQ